MGGCWHRVEGSNRANGTWFEGEMQRRSKTGLPLHMFRVCLFAFASSYLDANYSDRADSPQFTQQPPPSLCSPPRAAVLRACRHVHLSRGTCQTDSLSNLPGRRVGAVGRTLWLQPLRPALKSHASPNVFSFMIYFLCLQRRPFLYHSC